MLKLLYSFRGPKSGSLSFSSDAGGSLPHYVDGELVGLKQAAPGSLLMLLQQAINESESPPTDVIAALTRNPANALNLVRKGRIEPGADADLLLLEPGAEQLHDVFCLGRRLVRDGNVETNLNQAHTRKRSYT